MRGFQQKVVAFVPLEAYSASVNAWKGRGRAVAHWSAGDSPFVCLWLLSRWAGKPAGRDPEPTLAHTEPACCRTIIPSCRHLGAG